MRISDTRTPESSETECPGDVLKYKIIFIYDWIWSEDGSEFLDMGERGGLHFGHGRAFMHARSIDSLIRYLCLYPYPYLQREIWMQRCKERVCV